jgi:hypothetical protein
MDGKDAALSNTVYTKSFWVMDYLFAGVVFLKRIKQLTEIWPGRPFDSLSIVTDILVLLYCFIPLLAGIWFRRLLKAELHGEMMSTRTYVICDWRIAHLLFIVYLGMMIFSQRA